MNYQVLARKWRPHRFEDLIGQGHVLRALTNALDTDRLHHAYLFTGTRGVGKTTIARILAKSLNCERGVSSKPCGECSTCLNIDEGRFFDLIEVDAASRTKVEQTRELLENVPYAPASGRYKVYLIDEVHMFSDHSFNALLKTLEEPPEHVKFLLATTDPQKVPVTVLSRCLQFSLKRIPEPEISKYLAELMRAEVLEVEYSALSHIARAADGSMRDALSLLDQAIAYGEGEVLAKDVESMLGRPSPDKVLELVEVLGQHDANRLMKLVSVFAEYSPDFCSLLADILSVLHQIALIQSVPAVAPSHSFDPKKIRELAEIIPTENVHLFYQIALIGRKDIALTPDQREGFEMTLLRMLAFRPNHPQSRVEAGQKLTDSDTVKTVSVPTEPVRETNQEQPQSHSPVESNSKQSRSVQMAALKASLTENRPKKKAEISRLVKSASMATPVVNTKNQKANSDDLIDGEWTGFIQRLAIRGMAGQLLSQCVVQKSQSSALYLQLEKQHGGLLQAGAIRKIEQALNKYFNKAIKLEIALIDGELNTPARQKLQAEESRMQSARDSIESDPVVQKLCDALDGEIQIDSIRPVDG